MTYESAKLVMGRKPLDVVELILDYCSLTYSDSPCTASLSAGSECYNSRVTCQDVPNYAKTTKTYRFCSGGNMPVGQEMYPAIMSVTTSPTRAIPASLGVRGSITIKLKDFAHHDRSIDKYVSTRSYTPISQGTFFGKLIARNPYYIGREIKYRKGYVSDPFNWDDFEDRVYVIEKITGPDKNGNVTVTGKDRLKLADDERIQIPAPSTGSLLADITDVATSFSVNSGEGAGYAASGSIRVGDEDMTFTRATDAFTVVRAVNGTKADTHDLGDTVQECKVWTSTNVVDIIAEILTDYVGIDKARLPYDAWQDTPTGTNDDWDDEKDNWLSGVTLTRTIGEPTGAKKLLNELLEQNNLFLYHHQAHDLIHLKSNTPPLGNTSVTNYTDSDHLLKDSIKVRKAEDKRLSQVWIYYNKVDNAGSDEPANYGSLYVASNLTKEGANLYGSSRVKIIFANWLTSSSLAAQSAGRLLSRHAETPNVINFSLDAKDSSLITADIIDVSSHILQDTDGSDLKHRVQIVERQDAGDEYKYEAISSHFVGSYGFIGPDTLGDRNTESADNRSSYAFISPDSGFFADGDPAYKII